jgi:Holliday junction DNA helicase RuvA
MIGHLKGRLCEVGRDHLVLECHGIGFRVLATGGTLRELPEVGAQDVTVLTHLQLREGGADLFGFASAEEREIFHALTGVAGVGPKSGMSVLSALGGDGVLSGALRGDAKLFSTVPGIGKKLAQRMVAELPDRLKKLGAERGAEPMAAHAGGPAGTAAQEALEALVLLGYSRSDAQDAVSRSATAAGVPPEAASWIRAALAVLSGRR